MAGVTLVLKTQELSQRIKVEIFLLTHCTLAIFFGIIVSIETGITLLWFYN